MKNGAIGGYVYYPRKKWKWRIISGPKKGGEIKKQLFKNLKLGKQKENGTYESWKSEVNGNHKRNLEYFLNNKHTLNEKINKYLKYKNVNEGYTLLPNEEEQIAKVIQYLSSHKNNLQI